MTLRFSGFTVDVHRDALTRDGRAVDLSKRLVGRRDAIDSRNPCSHNDYMQRNLVGACELKARLGTYLRRVRQGRTLVVTDRGQPVAELRPIDAGNGIDAMLAKLKAAGAVTRTVNEPLTPFRQVESRGRSAAAVLEDREDRF